MNGTSNNSINIKKTTAMYVWMIDSLANVKGAIITLFSLLVSFFMKILRIDMIFLDDALRYCQLVAIIVTIIVGLATLYSMHVTGKLKRKKTTNKP